jgi:hypothetical protein
MKKYKVNLSYPAAIEIDGRAYMLFPGQEVELPENADIVKTYEALGYIKENAMQNKKVKGGTENAS